MLRMRALAGKIVPKGAKRIGTRLLSVPYAPRCRRLISRRPWEGDFKRIYHYHIRKTAGTSLNHAFLALGGEDPEAVMHRCRRNLLGRTVSNGLVCVGWNHVLIEQGDYHFAFSHLPYHEVRLPPDTFTFTCLRDPTQRVLSHYRMLRDFKEENIWRPCMAVEGKWLGRGLSDFLSRIPRNHLLNQLYMFSRDFCVDEAFERISSLSHFMFLERFSEGLAELSARLGLELRTYHELESKPARCLDEDQLDRLKELVAPEYELLRRLKTLRGPPTEAPV